MKSKFKKLIMLVVLATMVMTNAVPVMAKTKTSVDATLAVPPAFINSQYAILNPQTAQDCNYDIQKMYNYYMTKGAKAGQRMYATPVMTGVEALFQYMSRNRSTYIKNGTNFTFPYFNVQNYIALNQDLVALYGANINAYVLHYVNYGIYEGRPSGSATDPARIVLLNPTLASFNNSDWNPTSILTNWACINGGSTLTTALVANANTTKKPASQPVYTSSGCSHDWRYDSIDDDQHKKYCAKCCDSSKQDHDYYVYSQMNNSDASRHTLKCSSCGHKWVQSHYDNNGDCKCDKCGYISTHIHNYVVQTTGQDAIEHVVKCSCGTVKKERHTPKYVSRNNGTHAILCKVCGFAIGSEPCNYPSSSAFCSKCDYNPSISSHTHAYTTAVDNGDGTHSMTCSCGDQKPATTCSPNGAGETCATCGHSFPVTPSHTHSYTIFIDNGDGTHTPKCSCGDTQSAVSCSPNGAGETCSSCGHSFPVESHVHLYGTYISNGDGTHTATCSCGAKDTASCDLSSGVCSTCNYDPN